MDEALRGLSDIVLVAPPAPAAAHSMPFWPWLALGGVLALLLVGVWKRRRLVLLWLRWRIERQSAQACACRLYGWLQRWGTPLDPVRRIELERLCFGGEGDGQTLRALLREVRP